MTTAATHQSPSASSGHHAQEGAQALEFALVLPIFLAVLWSLISYGLIFTVDHTLSAAASEGARAAVGPITTEDAVAAATAAATEQLAVLGGFAGNATVGPPVVADCPGVVGTQCITVDVSYPWGETPIVPSLLDVLTPDVLTASSTIQLTP